jgi:hypothetical protein
LTNSEVVVAGNARKSAPIIVVERAAKRAAEQGGGAYHCPELLSAAAEGALRSIEAPVISILSEVELSSLISKKRRLKEFNQRGQRKFLIFLPRTSLRDFIAAWC